MATEITITSCRSCGARIRWVRTVASGALMPIDADSTSDGNVELDDRGRAIVHPAGQEGLFAADRWMPHHATCPQAKDWRRG